MIHWKDVTLWNLENEPIKDVAKRIPLLRKFRETGNIHAWRVDPADYDEEGNPRTGSGPDIADAGVLPAEIDWSDFPNS